MYGNIHVLKKRNLIISICNRIHDYVQYTDDKMALENNVLHIKMCRIPLGGVRQLRRREPIVKLHAFEKSMILRVPCQVQLS